jgi:medium-chain acyl-[acyl-carrier-protein] hydrolase
MSARAQNNSSVQQWMRILATAFATAKKEADGMAGRLARNARQTLARLRRLSRRARRAKTPEQILGIELKTEKFVQKKKFETSKTGKNGLLRPVALLGELQAIADIHATLLGAGRAFCHENNITWVVSHYAVDVIEMPNDKEEVSVSTWPVNHEALRAVRDFEITGADGRPLVRASSQWIMIDLSTRRPVRIGEYLPNWECLPERALNASFDKIAEPNCANAAEFDIRYDDIDVNRHVNNAVYATWATESLGYDFLDSHSLRAIKLNFKKEIPSGAPRVRVEFEIDGNTTRHIIKTDESTNAVVVCDWIRSAAAD